MKRAFLLLLLAIALFAGRPASSAEEVTLRFSWWGGAERHEATLKAIELFEKSHPGVTIKPEYMGWQGYLERLTTQYGSNSEPDIMQLDWAWLAIFSKQGDGFYDLNRARDKANLAAFDKKWLDTTTVNGKLNALPVSFTTEYFFWNKTTFAKAGLPVPSAWDDFFTMGLVFKDKLGDDYYCFDAPRGLHYHLAQTYMFQKTGKQFIDPQKPELAFTLDEIKDWIGFYKKTIDTHFAVPYPLRTSKGGDIDRGVQEMPDFVEGRWAGTFNWDATISLTLGTVKKEFEMVLGAYPTLKDAKTSGRIGRPAMLFGVSRNSKHPEVAAKFIGFLLTNPEAATILKTTRGILLSTPSLAELEKNKLIDPMQQQALDQIKGVQVYTPSPYFEDPRMIEILQDAFESVGFGKLTVDEAAQQLQDAATRLLRRLGR